MLPGNTVSLTSLHQTIFLSPFWLRIKMSVHQIQKVLQDRHQQMLSLVVEVISVNSAFTFIASFPAWLLKLPIASELKLWWNRKAFYRIQQKWTFTANGLYSNRFLEVLLGKTKHNVLIASMPGNTWHGNALGGRKAEQGTFSEHQVSRHHIKINSLDQVYFPFCVDVCC